MTPAQPPAATAAFDLLLFRSFTGLIWTRRASKEQTLIKHSFFLSVECSGGRGGEGRRGEVLVHQEWTKD